MERYRLYGQADDQPKVVGDEHFIGVDEYSNPENVQPGYVQKAVNLNFSTLNAETRGGFVCLPEVAKVPFAAGSNWAFSTTPVNKAWASVTYGNGKYIAVQSDGTGVNDIMYSADGTTWSATSSGILIKFACIAFGNGMFVAVGALGPTYNLVTSSGDALVASNGDNFVTQQSSYIAYSYDGLNWLYGDAIYNYNWSSVTYGGGLFVAVANGLGGTSQVITSGDGMTWTLRTTPATQSNHNWRSVVYGGNRFVAVASGGSGTLNKAMYSLDGITWVATSTPADPAGCVSVTYGNDIFVAVANTSSSGTKAAMTSTDGITWVERTTANAGWTSITYGPGTFMAVGNTGVAANSIMYSTDGVTWTKATAPGTNLWSSVVYAGNLYVAVSTDGSPTQVMTQSPVSGVYATGIYSDPATPNDIWIMIVGSQSVGFYSSGKSRRVINYPSTQYVTEQATIVQANNYVYLFRGPDETPLYWDGNWSGSFALVPATTLPASFLSIPNSNQAVYYQNRLWVVDGKDSLAASDSLAFTDYDPLANSFNLNTGNSDFVVASFPFGQNSLVCFKNKSIMLLQNVEGSLADVTVTEITRQVGLVGINAVTSIGPDLAYVSYGNINLLTLTNTNNSLQHKTLPLSSRIRKIMDRVNWSASTKISVGYWNNKLYVALPLDNSTSCNSVVVYNFITESWYGEWAFSNTIAMNIAGWVVVEYLGLQRLHAITEDGRIFVTDEGQNDISGATVAEISTEMLTRAYHTSSGNEQGYSSNHFQRRMFLDVATNRPQFSVETYTEGASESYTLASNQTFLRSQSWRFNDDPYDLTNADDDFNRAYRRDYSTGPASVESGTGFLPEMTQNYRYPVLTQRQGRLSWLRFTNSTGYAMVKGIGLEGRLGQRSSVVTV